MEKKCYVLICNGYNADNSVSAYWDKADAHKAMLNELDTEIKSLEAEGYKIREGYSSCTAEVYVPDTDIYYDWIIEETTII